MILGIEFQGSREELEAYAKMMNVRVFRAGETAPGVWTAMFIGTFLPDCDPPTHEATLTLVREEGWGEQYITAYLRKDALWSVVEAIDEEGNPAILSPKEKVDLCLRAERGEDETGR